MIQEKAGILDEHRAKQILAQAGIPTVTETIVATPEEAAATGRLKWAFLSS